MQLFLHVFATFLNFQEIFYQHWLIRNFGHQLALLQLKLKVTSEFIRPDAENYLPELPLPLKKIDVTKCNLEMGIFSFSFNATIIDKEDD